jgi:DnaJ-class molecular chaperone
MESQALFNYYDILEVNPHCHQHEITTAYQRMKSTYSGENPAIYTMFSEEEARDLLKLIEEAYSVLGNKTLRSIYDEKLGKSATKTVEITFEQLQVESKSTFNELPKKQTDFKIAYNTDSNVEKEIITTSAWTGGQIRKIREYKKIPLERMSEITKISTFYINAIENMDTENLPAAVFVRGYVGQIAKVLSLDDKKICDSYMKIYKEIGKK